MNPHILKALHGIAGEIESHQQAIAELEQLDASLRPLVKLQPGDDLPEIEEEGDNPPAPAAAPIAHKETAATPAGRKAQGPGATRSLPDDALAAAIIKALEKKSPQRPGELILKLEASEPTVRGRLLQLQSQGIVTMTGDRRSRLIYLGKPPKAAKEGL